MRLKNLARLFPKRSKATIVAKASSLKLPSAKLWGRKENRILAKFFFASPAHEIRKLLPKRSWLAILAQGERLGLARKRNAPRIKVNENYFRKWSTKMAYLLGYILADGCIIKGTYKGYSDALKFGVQKRDIDILEKIKKELESEHTISFNKNAAYLSITSQRIVDNLKKLGIIYRKSLREKIPKVPRRFEKDFIRGIVDGDGSVALGKDGYPQLGACGGWRTMKFIRNYFLRKFKIYSKISRLTKSKDGKHYLYSIGYRTNSAKTLIKYLYVSAPLYIDRKLKEAKKCMRVEINYQPKYTQKEDEILNQKYLVGSKNYINTLLPKRTWSSIEQRARLLGLYKHKIKNR
ncbi:MAG: hypothetical protein AAB577_00910 [Patescibacteria group bacterium]